MDRTIVAMSLPYIGNLYEVMPTSWAASLLVLVAALCGTLVGLEREAKHKPAGLRTVALICVGSAIFTFVSILIAGEGGADRGRIAAQVVTGIGFLGAGAIIRERGTVVGLTTGATIWTVSAIGVLIGAGYAAGGFALSILVVGMLRGARYLERGMRRPCRYERCQVLYKKGNLKTRLRILRVLDNFRVDDSAWSIDTKGEFEVLTVRYCTVHRMHRTFLFELAEMPQVAEIHQDPSDSDPELHPDQNHTFRG